MNWAPMARVGQYPPGSEEAIATADAYTYGAAGEALSQGQAMAAWAELSAAQNGPQIQSVSASKACPPGWLISPDGTTCVNIWNTHIALADKGKCSPQHPQWFECSELSLWFRLNHQWAFEKLSEAKKILPTALWQLGYLDPAKGWQNVRSQIHALARFLNQGYGISDGTRTYGPGEYTDLTEKQTEDALVNVAAPVYEAAIAKGGDVPKWTSSFIIPGGNKPASASAFGLLSWLLPLAVGAGALYYFKPDLARSLAAKGGKLALTGGKQVYKAADGVVDKAADAVRKAVVR